MSALRDFKDELDRTEVISERFKTQLRLIVGQVNSEAYERGIEQGRSDRHRAALAGGLTIHEERALVEASTGSDITLDYHIEAGAHYFANLLPGERVPAIASEARRLAAALLIRCRRGGVYDPQTATGQSTTRLDTATRSRRERGAD